MDSDTDLLEAWRAGDRSAGDELIERHFESVLRFFWNKVESNAEDLVQETFEACVAARDRLGATASFRAYLFGVARKRLFEHWRGLAREGRLRDPATASLVDLGLSPTEVVAARAEHRRLLLALQRIPLDAQILLELRYWEGLNSTDLAGVLGVPAATVRTRLRRARTLLEEALAGLCTSAAEVATVSRGLETWAREIRRYAHPRPP